MRHFLNGTEITPKDYEKIGLVLNFNDEPNLLSISTDSVTLVNEAMEYCLNHIYNGVGAAEGIPYQMVTETGQTLDYFIDFTEDHLIKSDEIQCKLKKRYAKDAFKKQADGLTFTNMSAKGVVFPSVDIPYVIVRNNQAANAITLAITAYTMEQALADAIKEVTNLTAEFISAVGVDVSDAVAAGIKLAAQIVYTAAIIIALIKLGQQIRELLFSKIRYFKGCTIKNLIKSGVEYLGYTLNSSLLDGISNETIVPVPIVREKENILDFLENDLNFAFNHAYPTAMDTTPTLGSLIDAVLLKNNARMTVSNNVVRIERRDFQFNVYDSLEPALVIQGERSDGYQLNTNELWKRSYAHYLVDYNDFHTLNEFDNTDCEHSTEPISVINPDLVMIKGFRDVAIPFALGSRKSKLNKIENIALAVFQTIDAVTSFFGNGTNLAALITNRIGVLQVGDQFFTQTKLLYQIGGKQPQNYLDFIGARKVESQYHNIDFIGNNDFIVREQVNCVIDSNDFVTLQTSNYVTINGKVCELLRVEFFDQMSLANITYKEPFDWAFNLKKVQIDG